MMTDKTFSAENLFKKTRDVDLNTDKTMSMCDLFLFKTLTKEKINNCQVDIMMTINKLNKVKYSQFIYQSKVEQITTKLEIIVDELNNINKSIE